MADGLARQLRLRGEASRHAEGEAMLHEPGDAVLIRRGMLRSMLLLCPDGCGDAVHVNLDRRAGKAWRMRIDQGGVTLVPSVWRDGGCKSHFIVWQHAILWCEGEAARGNQPPPYDPAVEPKVLRELTNVLRSPEEIGDRVNESAWEVSRVCGLLVDRRLARRGQDDFRDTFALPEPGHLP